MISLQKHLRKALAGCTVLINLYYCKVFQGPFKGPGPETKIAGYPSCGNPSLCRLGGIGNLNEELTLWRILPLIYTKEKGGESK